MQNQLLVVTETFKAAGTIVANTFVAGGPVAGINTAGAGLTANGVALMPGIANDMINVCTFGTVLVIAGGAIAENAVVDCDASGRAVTHAAGVPLGRTRGAVAALGQLVEVDLFKVNV